MVASILAMLLAMFPAMQRVNYPPGVHSAAEFAVFNSGAFTSTTSNWLPLSGGAVIATSGNKEAVVMDIPGFACTAIGFAFNVGIRTTSAASVSGGPTTFTVQKNNVDTTMLVADNTIFTQAPHAQQLYSDFTSTHSFAIAATDNISIKTVDATFGTNPVGVDLRVKVFCQ